jgi:hypothetical protein
MAGLPFVIFARDFVAIDYSGGAMPTMPEGFKDSWQQYLLIAYGFVPNSMVIACLRVTGEYLDRLEALEVLGEHRELMTLIQSQSKNDMSIPTLKKVSAVFLALFLVRDVTAAAALAYLPKTVPVWVFYPALAVFLALTYAAVWTFKELSPHLDRLEMLESREAEHEKV